MVGKLHLTRKNAVLPSTGKGGTNNGSDGMTLKPMLKVCSVARRASRTGSQASRRRGLPSLDWRLLRAAIGLRTHGPKRRVHYPSLLPRASNTGTRAATPDLTESQIIESPARAIRRYVVG
jgi:hypothetical protein